MTEVAGEGGGREGVLGRMREREAGAAIFVPGRGRVLALQLLNAERSWPPPSPKHIPHPKEISREDRWIFWKNANRRTLTSLLKERGLRGGT